jgi:hypothetical protein
MPPFFDNPDDPTSSISLHGVPLEIQRDGRVFAPAEDAQVLAAHGWRVATNQDDGSGELATGGIVAPTDTIPATPTSHEDVLSASAVNPPADQPPDDQTEEPPAAFDPTTADKAALRAFLAERGINVGPATGEDKMREKVISILVGG